MNSTHLINFDDGRNECGEDGSTGSIVIIILSLNIIAGQMAYRTRLDLYLEGSPLLALPVRGDNSLHKLWLHCTI